MRRRLVIGLVTAIGAGLVAAYAASNAGAIVTGPCSATLNGTTLDGLPVDTGHEVTVGKDDVVPMTMKSDGGSFSQLKISLTFGGFSWNVYNESAGGGTWSKNIDVNSFAKYGVGLYKVSGYGYFTSGAPTCSGAAMVKVDGNPFSTVAGIAGAATAGVGVLSVLGAGLAAGGGGGGGGGQPFTQEDATEAEGHERTRNDIEQGVEMMGSPGMGLGWCFLLTLAALPFVLLLGGGAMLMGAVAAPARWRPRLSVVGMIGGLLSGLGVGVLLQQYAILYPSRTVAIVELAAGLLIGGLLVPSLGRMRAVRRYNRRRR